MLAALFRVVNTGKDGQAFLHFEQRVQLELVQ